MSDRVVSVIRMPVAGPRAELEVHVVADPAPPRWRARLALFLVRLAGRLAKLQVRVVRD